MYGAGTSSLFASQLKNVNIVCNPLVGNWFMDSISQYLLPTEASSLVAAYNYVHKDDANYKNLNAGVVLTATQKDDIFGDDRDYLWEVSVNDDDLDAQFGVNMINLIMHCATLTHPNFGDMINSVASLLFKGINLFEKNVRKEKTTEENAEMVQHQQQLANVELQVKAKSITPTAKETQLQTLNVKHNNAMISIYKKYCIESASPNLSLSAESKFVAELSKCVNDEQVLNLLKLWFSTTWYDCEPNHPFLKLYCNPKINVDHVKQIIKHNVDLFQAAWIKNEVSDLQSNKKKKKWTMNEVKCTCYNTNKHCIYL